jgi:predicted ATP-grasp superfamily ATP-dependent carboligase
MKTQMLPIVVVGLHTAGLGVARSLVGLHVPIFGVYYDLKDMGTLSNSLAESFRAPHPERQEADFISFLINLAVKVGPSVLIPASDASLVAISHHKRELEKSYLVACVEWEIVERFIAKEHTYALAEAAGVPMPRTVLPHSPEEVEAYSRELEFPCLVKPSQSHRFFEVFRTKMFRVENRGELLVAYQRAAKAGLEVMLQELIPGEAACGANYNSYWAQNQPLVEFTARKIRNAPPDFGSPCVVSSAPVPEIVEPGRKILKALNFYGYACTEFKQDPRDGVYKLIEVNGRHNLSTLLAVRSGVNFPVIHYRHLVLGEIPQPSSSSEDIYWIDLTRDLGYNLFRTRSSGGFFAPYWRKHIFAILDFKDPKPFVKRCADLLLAVLQKNGA